MLGKSDQTVLSCNLVCVFPHYAILGIGWAKLIRHRSSLYVALSGQFSKCGLLKLYG